MKESAKREMRELSEHLNKVFKLVKSMKKDGKDVEGGRCMRSRSEEHTSELQSRQYLVCRLLLEKKN